MLYEMSSPPATPPSPGHPCFRVRGHSICIYVYLRYLEFVFVFWEACGVQQKKKQQTKMRTDASQWPTGRLRKNLF